MAPPVLSISLRFYIILKLNPLYPWWEKCKLNWPLWPPRTYENSFEIQYIIVFGRQKLKMYFTVSGTWELREVGSSRWFINNTWFSRKWRKSTNGSILRRHAGLLNTLFSKKVWKKHLARLSANHYRKSGCLCVWGCYISGFVWKLCYIGKAWMVVTITEDIDGDDEYFDWLCWYAGTYS